METVVRVEDNMGLFLSRGKTGVAVVVVVVGDLTEVELLDVVVVVVVVAAVVVEVGVLEPCRVVDE